MGLRSTRRIEKQLESAFIEMQQAMKDRVGEVDFKRWFKVMLEDCMLTEFEENLVCVPAYERDKKRKNQRNGFYYRSLQTVFGLIEELKIPRPREGGFTPSVFNSLKKIFTVSDKSSEVCIAIALERRATDEMLRLSRGVPNQDHRLIGVDHRDVAPRGWATCRRDGTSVPGEHR